MPDKETLARARRDKRQGKSPSTQAGEFIREEIHHIREGKHGARSTKQAIAIGLSKARRAGVKLPIPEKGAVPDATREQAERDAEKAKEGGHQKINPRRSRASRRRLKRYGRSAVSHVELAKHAKAVARRRGPRRRSASAKKAARTRRRNRD